MVTERGEVRSGEERFGEERFGGFREVLFVEESFGEDRFRGEVRKVHCPISTTSVTSSSQHLLSSIISSRFSHLFIVFVPSLPTTSSIHTAQ